MSAHQISIIIPVYKNYEMFYQYLETNKKYFNGCEVIIMNDYPHQNIAKSVKKIYPEAIVVNNKNNLGFAGNVNKGIMLAKRNYVFLMNSDVILRNDSFLKAVDHFKTDKDLFAVGFAQLEKNGKIVGANRGYFKRGFINHSHLSIYNFHQPFPNFWAEGGSSMFKKNLISELGMFDNLYNPFYWEDIDLSYRAWKAGYKIVFDSKTHVEHHHESTIGKYFDKSRILKIAFRNQLIFQWKNLTDKDLLIKHLVNLPKHIFTPGFLDALVKLPQILKARKKTQKLFKKTDKEILNIFQ
ncbi:glycosyltransferase family 2 protein [Candidatus Roizmanbacteria bacterium]|nr:glycosyltransferase family 2 protein [Candidatus Roizmanbacteria bacterium]